MIDTFSSFYYNTNVIAEPYNGYMNIDEGGGEITIAVPVSSYTLTSLSIAVRDALISQGTLDYTVSLDRVTRKMTISAPVNFDLLTNTGTQVSTSIWSLLGFDTASDLTGQNSYTSTSAIGSVYCPQFRLQNYVAPEIFQQANQASKNVAADGTTVEVINFGLAKFIEMDIKFITSRNDISGGNYIKKNSSGLEDAIDFLQYITRIDEFEFNPDIDNPGNFFQVILESTPSFPDGTGYKLIELFNQNLRDIYETGVLKLRVID